jgi:hypothetical protein
VEYNVSVRFGSRSAAILSAQRESANSLAAWHAVAPPDGKLPETATPIQRLIYTRMMTSEFVFQMARLRARRQQVTVPPEPVSSEPDRQRACSGT